MACCTTERGMRLMAFEGVDLKYSRFTVFMYSIEIIYCNHISSELWAADLKSILIEKRRYIIPFIRMFHVFAFYKK